MEKKHNELVLPWDNRNVTRLIRTKFRNVKELINHGELCVKLEKILCAGTQLCWQNVFGSLILPTRLSF